MKQRERQAWMQRRCESERIPVFRSIRPSDGAWTAHSDALEAPTAMRVNAAARRHGRRAPSVKRSVYNRPCLSRKHAVAVTLSLNRLTHKTGDETSMSEAPHGAPIKTPGQLIAAIIAGFAVPIVIIILLAVYVNNSTRTGAGTDMFSEPRSPRASRPSRKSISATPTRRASTRPARRSTRPSAPPVTRRARRRTEVRRCRRLGAAHRAKATTRCCTTRSTARARCRARGGTSPDDYSDFEIAPRDRLYGERQRRQASRNRRNPHRARRRRRSGGSGVGAAAPAGVGCAGATRRPRPPSRRWHRVPQTAAAPAAGAQSADASQAGKALYSRCVRRATRRAC